MKSALMTLICATLGLSPTIATAQPNKPGSAKCGGKCGNGTMCDISSDMCVAAKQSHDEKTTKSTKKRFNQEDVLVLENLGNEKIRDAINHLLASNQDQVSASSPITIHFECFRREKDGMKYWQARTSCGGKNSYTAWLATEDDEAGYVAKKLLTELQSRYNGKDGACNFHL